MKKAEDPPNNTLSARKLRDVLRRLMVAHAALDEAKRPCGTPLPMPYAWALLELGAAGPMTVTTLSEKLNIDRTNVSRLCARMEDSGEVERIEHPEDKRARLVKLTLAGQRLAEGVDAASAVYFERILDGLAADPGDVMDALIALTQAMASTTSMDTQVQSTAEFDEEG